MWESPASEQTLIWRMRGVENPEEDNQEPDLPPRWKYTSKKWGTWWWRV